jgi:hypothetical protein
MEIILYDNPTNGFRIVLIEPRKYVADLYRKMDSKIFTSLTPALLWANANTP